MRRDRFGNDVSDGRLHLLQQVLAIKRLERRGRARHDIDLSGGPGLADDALQEAFRVGAPDLDLDAVFLVEGRDQDGDVVGAWSRRR